MSLTPEAHAAVRRNLQLGLGGAAAGAAFLALLFSVISVPGGDPGLMLTLGSSLLVRLLIPVAAVSLTFLSLAFLFDHPFGFLYAKQVERFFGIAATELSPTAMRRWMRKGSYWVAFAKGALISLVFASLGLVVVWALQPRRFPESMVFISLWMVMLGGSLVARDGVIRSLYAERELEANLSSVSID